MRKENNKKQEQNGNEVTKEMRKECLALWKSKSGKCFMGVAKDETGKDLGKVVAFQNFNKKNEKEPDFRVYWVNDNGEKTEECVALWKVISKNKKYYLNGKTTSEEKVYGFFNKEIEGKNLPNISVYYR